MKAFPRASILCALAVLVSPGAVQRQPTALAITRVTVIDGTGAPARSDATVVVNGNRITTIGPSARTPVPNGALVINGRGKFLIPGLWDMHAHPFLMEPAIPAGDFLDLYLANGVTTIRDPAGPLDRQVAVRTATANG